MHGLKQVETFLFVTHDRRFLRRLATRVLDLDRGRLIDTGEPFRTSGCAGYDGEVACNRPFANSRPGPHLRNYPFPPAAEDIDRIRLQVGRRVPAE